jgi:hypothetical protein
MIFIRNNLTAVEMVQLTGQAAYAQLKFGNRKPGSESPLMFELADKHLKDCKDKSRKYLSPNLTFKRSFTARNIGDLPIYIHGFSINGLRCEGYGFSVLNCGPFELPVNGTRKIDVAFTPDFTLAKIERTLRVESSLGIDLNYTLITTLPPYFLSKCSAVLSRPTWEPLLYYSAVSFMIFLLFCVLAAAFFESDRILKSTMIMVARDKTAAPLDLKVVGANVIKEFTSQNKKQEVQEDKSSSKTPSNKSHSWMSSGTEDTGGCDVGRGEKYYGTPSSIIAKFDEPNDYSKEKDVQVCNNSQTTKKKKLGKKTSIDSEECKKKDKNGWCNVFTRTNTNDKVKLKLSSTNDTEESVSNVKQVRSEVEVKKEEKKHKKNKKVCKEEEETSSTTTDSSNDAEKENCEKARREEESGVDKVKKNSWKNVKNNSPSAGVAGVGVVKQVTVPPVIPVVPVVSSTPSTPPVTDKLKNNVKNNVRERREKTVNKRRFNERAPGQKTPLLEASTNHRVSPPISRWDQPLSFSQVVARNDSPLYSNIVSTKTQATSRQPISGPSLFQDVRKQTDSSTLGEY